MGPFGTNLQCFTSDCSGCEVRAGKIGIISESLGGIGGHRFNGYWNERRKNERKEQLKQAKDHYQQELQAFTGI